ncbi:MAG: transposase [bacterium]|nr:transposase [bacterium]
MAKKRVRRTWGDDEKRSICLQAFAPAVSTAQVARRYAMNANLIFKWLKDPRFTPDDPEIEETAFLPVEISTELESALPIVPQSMPVREAYRKRRVSGCQRSYQNHIIQFNY